MIAVSVADLFDVSESDTVWDAWLVTVNLIDILEYTHRIKLYDFAQARSRIAKICALAEAHSIDKGIACSCGLSVAEHALLKRKMMTFFKMQIANLKHFIIC